MTKIKVLASDSLGEGFSYRSFQAGLAENPNFIACDAGTSDSGPASLESGKGRGSTSVKWGLDVLLTGAQSLKVPFAIGSAEDKAR